jgi:hypothetical protein
MTPSKNVTYIHRIVPTEKKCCERLKWNTICVDIGHGRDFLVNILLVDEYFYDRYTLQNITYQSMEFKTFSDGTDTVSRWNVDRD